MSSISHLRSHSHYSIGQSASTPDQLIKEVSRLNDNGENISALALTDLNSLSGSLKFSKAAKGAKATQPIIGYDCKISLEKHGLGVGRVLLLAKNNSGFKKLCSLQMEAYRNLPSAVKKNEGENPYLAIPLDVLLSNHDDIILLTGKNEESLLFKVYKKEGRERAKEVATSLLKSFGDDIYLEFCRNKVPHLVEDNGIKFDQHHQSELFLQEIMRGGLGDVTCDDGKVRSHVMPVATSDIWYASEDRHLAWKIMHSGYNKTKLMVTGIPPMVVPDSEPPKTWKNDYPAYMKGTGETEIHLDDADRFHIRTREEMMALFSDMPYAVENSNAIAKRCHFHAEGRGPVLPPFKKPVNGKMVEVDEVKELRDQSFEGLDERIDEENNRRKRLRVKNAIGDDDSSDEYRVIDKNSNDSIYSSYIDRLEMELGIIESMGFPGYFLIVSDFIKWAKAHNIPVGPGRGSGAGSLVAYSLRITNLDPLRYGLLFERFLNPERVSMPDFDIDFCIENRERVIEYVTNLYGKDQVSQIATFGEIKPKSSVGVIQRSVVVSDTIFMVSDKDRISKALSDNPGLTNTPLYYYHQDDDWLSAKGEKYEKLSSDVHSFYKAIKEVDRDHMFITDSKGERLRIPKASALLNYGSAISGLFVNRGIHAAGVVIGGDKLTNLFPVILDETTLHPVSAYDQKDSEGSGAVKFDFLGLRNLTIIQEAVNYAKEFSSFYEDGFFTDSNGNPNTLTIDDIILDDQFVFDKILSPDSLKTCGIFQMSSPGMRSVIAEISPTSLDHLCAINALYRPGPKQYIESFAKRRSGDEVVEYPGNPEITEPLLKETYGYMIYQEQVMQIAQRVAGYSLGGADLLRRAMGKKIAEEMALQRKVFVHGDDTTPGAIKFSGMSEEDANKLFDDINAFANYGFNKSHAMAYALLAYQTAWLKAYYTAPFLSAVMSYEESDLSKNEDNVNEARSMGVEVLPPDVNRSRLHFTPEINNGVMAIRYGFKGLKSLINLDPEENKPEGGYVDIIDFLIRNPSINKAKANSLIDSGALDGIAFNESGWRDLPEVSQGSDPGQVVDDKEAEIKSLETRLEIIKNAVKEAQKAARKKDASDADLKSRDEVVRNRDILKAKLSDEKKALKRIAKAQESIEEDHLAFSRKGGLIDLIKKSSEKNNALLSGREGKIESAGYVRAVLKAVYDTFSNHRKVMTALIKDGADIDEISEKVRVEILKTEDILKAFSAQSVSKTNLMVNEKGVFDWYFNLHPLEANKKLFEKIGAYPASAWKKYCRFNGGSYPATRQSDALKDEDTPTYAIVAGMLKFPPRYSERVNKNNKGVIKKKINITITDRFGGNMNCGYDCGIIEHLEEEYDLNTGEEWNLKKTIAPEIRDRQDYLMNTLNKCYSAGKPVILKGTVLSYGGGDPYLNFSWATGIDDIIARIPNGDLRVVIDEEKIVDSNGLDLDDPDDRKELETYFEQVMTSIRKELFVASAKELITESHQSVYKRERRGNLVPLSNVESGSGSKIVIVRKKAGNNDKESVEIPFYANRSDGVGKKKVGEYYDKRYIIDDSVRVMLGSKPFVTFVDFVTLDDEEIARL